MKNLALLHWIVLAGGAGGWNTSALEHCIGDAPVNAYGCEGGEPRMLSNCCFLTRHPCPLETTTMQSVGTVLLSIVHSLPRGCFPRVF